MCNGRPENLGLYDERQKIKIWVPYPLFAIAMDFLSDENPKVLITHTMNGLEREALIGEFWSVGNTEYMNKREKLEVDSSGIVFRPSAVGLELYLWAHGLSSVDTSGFLTADFSPMTLDDMAIPEGAKLYAPDIDNKNRNSDR
jgi:hypothetical protein